MKKKEMEREIGHHKQNLQHLDIEVSNIRKIVGIILKKLEEEDLIKFLRIY